MPSDRVSHIEKFMLDSMRDHKIEDTTRNRLTFLLGVKNAWDEIAETEPLAFDQAMERMLYRLALTGMIAVLEMKLMFDIKLDD